MKIKPLRIEIDCVYTCPSCKADTWYTIRELKYRKHLTCVCGKQTLLEPVRCVEVRYAGKAIEQLDKSGQRVSPAFPLEDFVVTLTTLGYTKSNARQLVLQHQHEYRDNDSEFLAFLLQQGVL